MIRLLLGCGLATALLTTLPSLAGKAGATTSSADLVDFLNAEAITRLTNRHDDVAEITTRQEAEARQAEVRTKVLALIGEPVHGMPLNARTTGTLEGEGFRIENVLYDSQPGRHVTANLYLPEKGEGPFPAVIISPGHGPNGKIGNYGFASNLARNGIAALSYDIVGEGERLEYFDPATGKSRGERPTGDHSLAAFPAILAGEHVSRYFIEDAMQGVDYLVSRSEIDANRIGAFGCSGGGTITAYLAALDARVKAVATACYVTDFAHLLPAAGPQEAEQSIPGFIAAGLDIPDWVELAAPKPYAVVSTTEDMFPFAGAAAAVDETRRFWAAYGAADKLEWITGPGGHGAIAPLGDDIVDFFRRSLEAEAPAVAFAPLAPADTEALLVTETGQLATSTSSVTLADIERARIEAIRPAAQLSTAQMRAVIAELAHVKVSYGDSSTVRAVSRSDVDGLTYARFELVSPRGPLDLRTIRQAVGGHGHILLVLDTAPMDSIAGPGGPLAKLAREGWGVVALQARGADVRGEAKSAYVGEQNLLALRAMLTGYTLPGLRIEDAIAAMNWIESTGEGRPVTIVGVGTMGPVALQAALLDTRIDRVRIERSPVSLRAAASLPIACDLPASTVPGMLARYDLPDVIAALSPRLVTAAAPIDPLGQPLGEADFLSLVPGASNVSYTEELFLGPAISGFCGRQ